MLPFGDRNGYGLAVRVKCEPQNSKSEEISNVAHGSQYSAGDYNSPLFRAAPRFLQFQPINKPFGSAHSWRRRLLRAVIPKLICNGRASFPCRKHGQHAAIFRVGRSGTSYDCSTLLQWRLSASSNDIAVSYWRSFSYPAHEREIPICAAGNRGDRS